jgi:hypothetical protein
MGIAITIFFIFCTSILAKEDKFLPEIVNSNFGNEFIISMPPNLQLKEDDQNSKIRFILYSPVKANVKIEVPLKGFSEQITLQPYERQVLSFNPKFAQAISKNGFEESNSEILIKSAGLRFYSNQIFSLVVLSDFEETADAILALPTEMLGTNYVLSGFQDQSDKQSNFNNLSSSAAIIGTKDNTKLNIHIGGRIGRHEVGTTIIGKKIEQTINKGDVFLLNTIFNGEDLSGTVVSSDKPIGIISSNQCAEIPKGNPMCDFIADFEIPKKALGKKYLVSPIAGKKYLPIVRVFAFEDSTEVYKNGEKIAFFENIGKTEDAPFIEIIDSNSVEPFLISSNKKIKTVVYSRSFEEDDSSIATHNPFMMSLQPLDRMQNEIYFSTPNNISENFFPENNFVNLTIDDKSDEISANTELGIIYNNEVHWESIDEYIYSAQKLSSTIGYYQSITLELPFPIEYKIRSDKDFSASVYGTNQVKSYGYPATLPMSLLNGLDSIPPNVTWEQECGGIIRGEITDETIPLGTTLLFDWDNFKPDLNVTDKNIMPVNWHLEAIDKSKPASATISFWDAYKNRSDVFVNYEPLDVIIEPDSIDFGNMDKGVFNVKQFKIINNSYQDIYFDSLENDLPVTLFFVDNTIIDKDLNVPANSEIILNIGFQSEIDTSFVGKIKFFNDCLGFKEIFVKGEVSSPIIEVSDITQQDIALTSARSFPATIKNIGTRELLIYGYDYPSSNYISIRGLPEANSINPFKLGVGKSIDIQIEIDAERVGQYLEFFVVRSNAIEIDSICRINYRVINPGLVAEGFNWNRGKIDVENYEFGPYESESKILLRNTGLNDIKITDHYVINEKNGESFIFENLDQLFESNIIEAGSELEIGVSFDPIALDTSSINIAFQINEAQEASTVLSLNGFGTRPKAGITYTKNYKSFIGSNQTEKGVIRIKNLSRNEWKYADIIENFSVAYDKNLAEDIGFRLGGFLGQDIEIGESIEIPVSFTPKEIGEFSLPITINTEAILDENKIELIASVKNLEIDINIENSKFIACSGEKDTIKVEITNLAEENITLESFKFDPPVNNFSIIDSDNSEREFSPDEKIEFFIEFTSFGNYVETELVFKIKDQLSESRYKLTGENQVFQSMISITPDFQEAQINSTAGSMIAITSEEIPDNFEEVHLVVEYDRSFLNIEKDNLFISDNYKNEIGIDNLQFNDGSIEFNIYSLQNGNIPTNQEILGLTYDILLPSNSGENTEIEVKAYPIENSCVKFGESSKASLKILENCDESFRRITSSGFEFFIDEIAPNPISANTEINFGIGVEAQTIVLIQNSNGFTVNTLFDSYISPGVYSITIPAEELPSGVYFLKISALVWSESKPFIIKK